MKPKNSEPILTSELRKFGLLISLFTMALFGLILPFLFGKSTATWPFVMGGVILTWAWLDPKSLFWLYQPWMRAAGALGWLNTRIFLSLIFYLVFTPFGVVRRLINGPASKPPEYDSASYRKLSTNRQRNHMEKLY